MAGSDGPTAAAGILSDWLIKANSSCFSNGCLRAQRTGNVAVSQCAGFYRFPESGRVAASAWVIQTALFVSYYRAQDALKATGDDQLHL
jgi:hypothetical protein